MKKSFVSDVVKRKLKQFYLYTHERGCIKFLVRKQQILRGRIIKVSISLFLSEKNQNTTK